MVSGVKQFEMQGYYHTTVEMYRDTTDRRNTIQKQVGAMQEKYGPGGQTFTTYKTKNRKRRRTTAEQERYNEVRKKQRQ
jgi:hypothetical protein